jgi:hypothetical protein
MVVPMPIVSGAAMETARQRYGGLSAEGKHRLLAELEVITGYHRKSLLRLLHRQLYPAGGLVSSSSGQEAPSPPRQASGGSAAGAAGVAEASHASVALA